MPRITAVSFDADGIRVVTGQRVRTGFTVERTLFLATDELDAFLSLDRADEYLVAVSPEDAQYETIAIPPVAPKLEAPLIQAETTRLHHELLPFSCGWRIMGDFPLEGRTVRKVACCLVPHHSIEPLLEPFIRHNKNIRCLVAAPVILAKLVRAVTATEEPLLCAYDTGTSKLLFLLQEGAVTFARAISSNERGWDVFDRQNVAMTMDYCFQSLRIQPSRVLVLNPTLPADETAPPPRLEQLELPSQLLAGLQPEILLEYQVPFLLAAWPMPPHVNLLPASYQAAQLQQRVLRGCIQWFGIGIALMLIMIGLQTFSLTRLQSEITNLRRQEGNLASSHQAHRQALAERDQLQPMINTLSNLLAAPDIPATLVALNGLRIPETQLNSLVAKRDKNTINLQLTGKISATGFAASQERFEAMTNALQQVKGVTAGTRRLDSKAQSFTIEAVRTP